MSFLCFQLTETTHPGVSLLTHKYNPIMLIDDTLPLAALTVADFKILMSELSTGASPQSQPSTSDKHYVYGLQGIQDLFGCSHVTAQHYKDTFLRKAISQRERKIVVDADMAMELFKNWRAK